MAANWYAAQNRYRPRKQQLATSDAQPKVAPATRNQPSWVQLRSRMELADALQVAWVDTIGFYIDEEELGLDEPVNSATPIQFEVSVQVQKPTFVRPAGQIIDAQVIALNRTIPPMPVTSMLKNRKAAVNQQPNSAMMRLEQISHGQLFRLAGALA